MIDLNDPRSFTDPAGYFATFRAAGPVHWSEAHRAWIVIGHQALTDAFRDPVRLSSDRISPLERVAEHRPEAFQRVVALLSGWMVFRDPPEHTRLRDPVRDTFTPRRVASMTELITHAVERVLAELPDPGVTIDVRAQLASPLPAAVIAAVLGVDPDQRERFVRWSDELATMALSTTPHDTPPESSIAATEEFNAFFGALIEAERVTPSNTLLTTLVAAAGDSLSEAELVGACTILLFAGHETTTSLIANALGLLLERPELAARWRAQLAEDATSPGGGQRVHELAIEELLRTVGPARSMMRKVVVDHEREGQQLRAGQNVVLAICAANHDPAVFDAPQDVRLDRDPNPHVSFGWGLHHCVGAHLARLEATLLLRALLERYSRWEAAAPIPAHAGTILGYAHAPLLMRLQP